ncbi:ABZJ_00895 family protein [Acinetobacter bohemicus]|uniref:ABZJ_00895 family protein n=1 Tax=Acinetobacter lwoffii TaxID=28090 RepID=A0A9D2UQL9_ACILW|nr:MULTISPECIES: ABZJ_00895 family protein [Acinetobacter]MCO8041803.1 ABZJ_00895 family protein [Acinetobacter sp. S4400-12]MCO8044374.1 ABZJ_00895 family protein [Acinetobacter sp. S4397-1]MCU7225741.1 ABZJ_00895 family protein [Acinetobacter bohemicus]HJF26934.1 ABZJ_00895 family protein [Acinetobacter lwoffii]
MSHYLKYFATIYLALVILIGILIYILNLGVIILIPALIAAAFLSARHFVKTQQRLPSKEEKSKLVWGSTTIAMAFGFIFLFVMIWLHPQTEEVFRTTAYAGRGPNSFLVAALIGLHGLVFHIAYNGYARYSLAKLLKKPT